MQKLWQFLLLPSLFSVVPNLLIGQDHGDSATAKTPIKYLVVIVDQNNDFDYYFGTKQAFDFDQNRKLRPASASGPDEPSAEEQPNLPVVPVLVNVDPDSLVLALPAKG